MNRSEFVDCRANGEAVFSADLPIELILHKSRKNNCCWKEQGHIMRRSSMHLKQAYSLSKQLGEAKFKLHKSLIKFW